MSKGWGRVEVRVEFALRMLSIATACVATSSASEQRYVEMGHLAQSEAPLPVTTRRCSHPCLWLRVEG